MLKINLITGNENTASVIKKQLTRVFDSKINIDTFLLDVENNFNLEVNKVTVFSSKVAYDEFVETYDIRDFGHMIIAQRDINFLMLDKIFAVTSDKKILMVNDAIDSAQESINSLKNIGFDYLDMTAYCPGCNLATCGFETAITTGEVGRVPAHIKEVFDLGPRVLSFGTIYSIMKAFDCCDQFMESLFESNSETLVKVAMRASDFARENSILTTALDEKTLFRGHKARHNFDSICGKSKILNKTKELAKKLAKTDMTILIKGESGTGKELFANAIHNESSRKKFPFLAVNFSSLPDSLIESELFGYEEGAFTGAKKGGKKGLFELANGGTIFLDEIGDISIKMQTRLLRVIQEKEIMRVGSSKIIPVDVRIVAATNQNLEELIRNKEFREDLYYRLKVGQVIIPPIRDRVEDIEEFVNLEIGRKSGCGITKEALMFLKSLPWLGNIRELKNTIECALALSETGVIGCEDLLALEGSLVNEDVSKELHSLIVAVDEVLSKGRLASRQLLLEVLSIRFDSVTEHQVRRLIDEGLEKGLIAKVKGSYGLRLTEKGREYI